MGWYIIHVEQGCEEEACKRMRLLCDNASEDIPHKTFIPIKLIYEYHHGRFVRVEKKLFPGYILVETDCIVELFILTRFCERLLQLVPHRNSFKEIDYEQIRAVMELMDQSGVVGISEGIVASTYLSITKGPLMFYNGFVYKIDKRKRRAKINFRLNGSDHLVDLGIDIVGSVVPHGALHRINFAQE